MRKMFLSSSLACLLAVVLANVAGGVEVKLAVKESAQAARSPGLITTGVPFARGAVKDVAKLTASLAGKTIPVQFTKTAGWDDGSVRWALMDCQADVPAGGTVELTVSDAGGNPAPAAAAKVDQAADSVAVSTGPLQFVIDPKKSALFQSLKVDGKELVTSAGRGLVLVTEDGKEVVAGPPSEVKIEQAGPMRAVVCLRGKFPGVHNDLLAYTVRVSAFAGSKLVKVHAWLENQGAMGYWHPRNDEDRMKNGSPNVEWFKFSGLNIELGLGLGLPGEVAASCQSAKGTGDFKVFQTCKLSKANPPTKTQSPPLPYFTWDDFEYTVTSGGKELAKGDRTDGIVNLSGANGSLVAGVRDFWQNYDKAIELTGDKLKLWLWPTDGQWPRATTVRTSPQYADVSLHALHAGVGHFYYLQGGVNKGYECVLDFSGRDPKAASAELSSPLWAVAPAEYYAATEAAPGLFAAPRVRTGNKTCDAKLDAWMRMTESVVDPENPFGFIKTRQEVADKRAADFQPDQVYWFGWMDYGDIPIAGSGPVSLQYDWTWIMLLNAMRTGDVRFMDLGRAMAHYRIDIAQDWSDRDPPEARGLQRGNDQDDWTEVNSPALHCHSLWVVPTVRTNWLAGVALYYMLTGEPKALECCQRNAAGVKAAWAYRWAPRGDMGATAWSISAYLAAYDLTADKSWLDEALGLFKTNVTQLWRAEGPFLHDPDHQIRGQGYAKEDQKYCWAISALCDLHRHTGDKDLLKLLTEGCQSEFPGSFFEAPKFLADLYAYVGYVTGNAEYVAKAADLFNQGFPQSKCPPVVKASDSTWSRAAAMTLRAGHILQYVNWKMKDKK